MELFITLSLTVVFAVVISGLMRALKQPLIIGYILTGIVLGPYFFNLFSTNELFETLSQIGVAFLLFMVGLHLNPKVIKEVGKVSLITGIGQVIFTSVISFLISMALGFSLIASIYISVALTFSSTIIIMKLLYDKKDLDTLYGKIAIGFLIVQDLIAVFALMIIPAVSGGSGLEELGITFLKGLAAMIGVFLFSFYLLPTILKKSAKSQEFLFLLAIGWSLAIASLFLYLGFSLEIGALLAGMAIALSPYSMEISSKVRPLRDFFLILFFIIIGSQITFLAIKQNILPIIIFSLFILIGNPLIVMAIMKYFRYTKKTSFLAGLTVAQISEFSIILVALGVGSGHLSNEILSLVTMTGLITIAGSTYMILYSDKIYSKISRYLGVFERKGVKRDQKISEKYSSILFGYNRTGFEILTSLSKLKKSYLVVDFNPETITSLKRHDIPCLYGDIEDPDLLGELNLDKIDLAVSTVPNFDVNFEIIEAIRIVNKDAIIVVRANNVEEALKLYKKGANYVLTTHFLGGDHVAKMIRDLKTNKKGYDKEKSKHMKRLREIMKRDKGAFRRAHFSDKRDIY